MSSGRVVIWTEATPKTAARQTQAGPALRNILEIVQLEPQSEADTAVLATAVQAHCR